MDRPGQLEPPGGLEQESAQLRAPFTIAPVADPDEVADPFPAERSEDTRVRRLVPHPDPVVPAPLAVDLRDRPTEGAHACVAGEVVAAHLLGASQRSVVRVV